MFGPGPVLFPAHLKGGARASDDILAVLLKCFDVLEKTKVLHCKCLIGKLYKP